MRRLALLTFITALVAVAVAVGARATARISERAAAAGPEVAASRTLSPAPGAAAETVSDWLDGASAAGSSEAPRADAPNAPEAAPSAASQSAEQQPQPAQTLPPVASPIRLATAPARTPAPAPTPLATTPPSATVAPTTTCPATWFCYPRLGVAGPIVPYTDCSGSTDVGTSIRSFNCLSDHYLMGHAYTQFGLVRQWVAGDIVFAWGTRYTVTGAVTQQACAAAGSPLAPLSMQTSLTSSSCGPVLVVQAR